MTKLILSLPFEHKLSLIFFNLWKHIPLLIFCIFYLQFQGVKAESEEPYTGDYKILIYADSQLVRTVRNFEKFTMKDTWGETHTGKIIILNDSQFSYTNYFLEAGTDTIHTNAFMSISSMNDNKSRKYFDAPVVAAVILLAGLPAILYFGIRELVLLSKEGRYHSKKYSHNQTKLAGKKFYMKIVPDSI